MKFTWGHGVAVALGAFIIFILSFIVLFPIGKQRPELITDNYYEEELMYQNVIDAKNNADALQEKPEIKIEKKGITLFFPKEYNNENSSFSFLLYRPNDRNLDVNKTFQLSKDNSVFIPSKIIFKGSYILKVKWQKDKKNYQIDYNIAWN